VECLRAALADKARVRIVTATGVSQFTFLEALIAYPDVDWSRVTMFHLDEYIGLGPEHPASFRQYLQERLLSRVSMGEAIMIEGETDPIAECRRLNALISMAPIDLLFCGIGENGHLAFNDPPADFETEEPYVVVDLDEVCRRQQLGEGWFPAVADVPTRAISMSIRQIMRARQIICTAPGQRKAVPVRDCLEGDISPLHPASILRQHSSTDLYLDTASASLLRAPAT
jgi:glucosamine-6-phosphate deaminase